MPRIVCVSNRVSLPDPETGEIKAGGLAVGVKAALKSVGGGIWFGWSGRVIDDNRGQERPLSKMKSGEITFITMPLTRSEYDYYYKGMANEGLWPLMHELGDHIDEDGASFAAYEEVNRLFARQLKKFVQPGDVIWVHDYHLFPLGCALRAEGLDNKILFFNHIPIPSPSFLAGLGSNNRVRQQFEQLLFDLLSYDQVGFQTFRDLRNFKAIMGVNGAEPRRFTAVPLGINGGHTRFGVFPISIETRELELKAARSALMPEIRKMRTQLNGHKLIIGAERLDYTKGLLHRVDAVAHFLSGYPDYWERFNFHQITPLSRSDIDRYRKTIHELEDRVAEVDEEFSSPLWHPIRLTEDFIPRDTLLGYFRLARVGLVTPLMDGQNLVAKEFVAAQDPHNPGSLILSKYAGAAEELGETGAFLVDPRDPDDIARKLKQALDLPLDERIHNYNRTITLLRQHDINNWANRFIHATQ